MNGGRLVSLSGTIVAMIALGSLTGCATGPRKPTRAQVERIDRVLTMAPGAAQPSTIVATEIAFARMARERGQWTGFDHFAAADAVLHGASGPFPAKAWLATQKNPAKSVAWAPRNVWMSCDASLAVSTGGYRDPEGKVGVFVTVWERQADGTYRWVYDGGADDNPQPPPVQDAADPDTIVVAGIDTVRGEVADCPARGAPPIQPLAQPLYPEGTRTGGGVSRDGSLAWHWVHAADGRREFVSHVYRGGQWQEAARFDYADGPAG